MWSIAKKKLKEMATIVEKKEKEYGTVIYIISDEPYSKLVYDGIKIPQILNIFQNSILVNSFSKSHSLAGERIGYIAVNDTVEGLKDLLKGLVFCNRILGYVNAPALFQQVVSMALYDTVDPNIYQERRDILYTSLTEMGYSCVKPQGAFYLFPKTLIPDDMEFKDRALKHHLVIVPGSGFNCPGHFRISYCVSLETIKNSLPAFEALANELRSEKNWDKREISLDIKNFEELIKKVQQYEIKKRVAVIAAHDEHTLEAVMKAKARGILSPILIGDTDKIVSIMQKLNVPLDSEIMFIPSENDEASAEKGVELIHQGLADIIMKGKIQTADLLKAVVNTEKGLRTERIMSHFVINEIPNYHKLVVLTDGGMVMYPDLEQKKEILANATRFLINLGYDKPKVAALAAVEIMNKKNA